MGSTHLSSPYQACIHTETYIHIHSYIYTYIHSYKRIHTFNIHTCRLIHPSIQTQLRTLYSILHAHIQLHIGACFSRWQAWLDIMCKHEHAHKLSLNEFDQWQQYSPSSSTCNLHMPHVEHHMLFSGRQRSVHLFGGPICWPKAVVEFYHMWTVVKTIEVCAARRKHMHMHWVNAKPILSRIRYGGQGTCTYVQWLKWSSQYGVGEGGSDVMYGKVSRTRLHMSTLEWKPLFSQNHIIVLIPITKTVRLQW